MQCSIGPAQATLRFSAMRMEWSVESSWEVPGWCWQRQMVGSGGMSRLSKRDCARARWSGVVWLGTEGVSGSRVQRWWTCRGEMAKRRMRMQCRAIWWCVSGCCGVVQAGVPLLCRAFEMSSCRAGEAGGDRDEAAGKKSPRAMHQCVTSVADGSARGSSTREICAVLGWLITSCRRVYVCACVCVRRGRRVCLCV